MVVRSQSYIRTKYFVIQKPTIMKRTPSFAYVGLFALAALLAFSLTAFNQTAQPTHRTPADTTPKKGEYKVKDIDDVMVELDKAMLQMDKDLKKSFPAIPVIDAAKLKAEKDVTTHPASLSRVLLKAGLSFKKNAAGHRGRARGRAPGA